MSIVVRPAESGDVDDLVDLNRIVHSAHAIAEPRYFRAEVDRAKLQTVFETLLSSVDSYVLLAELEDRPVGYVWFDVQERSATPFTLPQKRLSIQHIAVREDVRRRGVASTLLRAVEADAVARDVCHLILNTWSFNEGAQTFFRVAGFEPMSIALRKSLIPASE